MATLGGPRSSARRRYDRQPSRSLPAKFPCQSAADRAKFRYRLTRANRFKPLTKIPFAVAEMLYAGLKTHFSLLSGRTSPRESLAVFPPMALGLARR